MNTNKRTYIKNILLPCLLVSSLAGIFTGGVIFLFKLASSAVIHFSAYIYLFVRQNPLYLPLFVLGAAVIALLATLILKYEPASRGGGIPNSIAILRGLISCHWLKTLLATFTSSLLTYLGGIPLGTEGPSVQMGTSVGHGTSRLFGKKNAAWDRYVMTGSACAGFACATGAPITGIVFAFEEAHRRFSPMIFMAVASAVLSGYATTDLLCSLTNTRIHLFDVQINAVMPFRYIWMMIGVGLVAGLVAIAFTRLYQFIGNLISKRLSRLPLTLKVVMIFAATVLIGFFSANLIGTGHELIEELLDGKGIWYLLLLYLALRALLLIIANHVGITGGLFIPSLAFGALIGALCSRFFVALELLPREYCALMICVGMAAFLAACSRTPLMAIAFAAEALGCIFNLLPIIAGVTFSCLIIEAARVICFTDTVIEKREKEEHKGKTATVVDEHITVAKGAFVIEKEINDVLWPPTCTILSVSKKRIYSAYDDGGLQPGDVLHLHYISYDVDKTREQLEALVGKQNGYTDPEARVHTADESHQVPQL